MANFLKRWYTGLKTGTVKPTELETLIQDRLMALEERLNLEHNSLSNGIIDKDLASAGGRHPFGVGFPIGTILMVHSYFVSTLPDGWVLCDGTTHGGYNTPDCRGRFPMGPVAGYDSSYFWSTKTDPTLYHSHTFASSNYVAGATGAIQSPVGITTQNNLLECPYFVVKFIMKVS